MNHLARAYAQRGEFDRAERLLRRCLALRRRNQPEDWRTFHTLAQLGASLPGRQKHAEAEPLLLTGYQGMKQRQATIPANDPKSLAEALQWLAQLYDSWGKPDQAQHWRQELKQRKG